MISHRNYQRFQNLVTGDEKWALYMNYTHRRQSLSAGQTGVATPKTDPHPKKVTLSVWWGVNRIIHWEILLNGWTMTAVLYCQQLDQIAEKLKGKQDRIYYLHDKARSHVAKSTHEKFLKLGRISVPHPPYSPNLVPTDCHLIQPLSDHLREKKYDDENNVKMKLVDFFGKKS